MYRSSQLLVRFTLCPCRQRTHLMFIDFVRLDTATMQLGLGLRGGVEGLIYLNIDADDNKSKPPTRF